MSEPTPISGRPRDGVRWVRFSCLGCAAIPFLLLAGYLFWANQLPPPEPENVSLPNPNGFDACVAAVNQLHYSENGPLTDATITDPVVLRKALEPEEPALNELRHAMKLPYVTPPVQGVTDPFPYLKLYRDAARKFSAESRAARAEGKRGEAIERALDAVELGGQIGKGGPLIHGLVAVAISAIGTAAAEPCVRGLSAQEAHAAGERLDRIRAKFVTSTEVLEAERRFDLKTLRMIFSGKASMNSASGATVTGPADRISGIVMAFYPKAWAYRSEDAALRAMIAESRKPFPQQQPVPVPKEMFSQMLLPVMDQATFAFIRSDTRLVLVRTELALEEFKARRGHYPESLAQLDPAPPADPFSTRPLVYRRKGNDYVLYSVGPDGKDDGGQALPNNKQDRSAKGDIVAGTLTPKRNPIRPGTASQKR